jgi:hypothetical protein
LAAHTGRIGVEILKLLWGKVSENINLENQEEERRMILIWYFRR